MTHISASNDLIPADADFILRAEHYNGFGKETQPVVFGPECEFFIGKIDAAGKLFSINAFEAGWLKSEYFKREGKSLEQEAIHSHFELNFNPTSLKQFDENDRRFQQRVKALYETARSLGFHVIPSSHGPHIAGADDINEQLTRRERIQILVPNGQKYLGDPLVVFANGTAGIHVSSGYHDPDQLFRDMRRTYYASPVDYALTNNGFPFWMGMKPAGGINPRLAAIENYARTPTGRTGIDPLFYTAVDGEDFTRDYLERAISASMMAYYPRELTNEEKEKGLTEPPLHSIEELPFVNGKPPSFRDLETMGLNTEKNFKFAASCFWYGVKLADIPDLISKENGKSFKRLERRVPNSGVWQLSSSLLEAALVTSIDTCGEEHDMLLDDFGFDRRGPAFNQQSALYLEMATKHAAGRSGMAGLAFPFGKYTALEFERQRLQILQKHAAPFGLSDVFAPREYIARTNMTDARVLYDICKTPEDVCEFIAHYDAEAMTNPRICFGMMGEAGQLPALSSQSARAQRIINIPVWSTSQPN